MTISVVVAEMIRGGVVESRHHGSAVVTARDGTVEWSTGPVAEPMFPRSANKPMQALGMLRCGLDLDGELLALAAGSHSGETIHVEGVRRILGDVGLDETALRNPRAYPFDTRARKAWMRAGLRKKAVTMGCSGKHAAMLATCVTNGWPTQGYLDPSHPLQLAIRAAVQDCANERVTTVTVDGCGAPLLALSLTGLARAFGRMASAEPETREGRIASAFRDHPQYASGTRRTSAKLIRSTPGLFCKTGAEGVVAAGFPDGRGIAVKIDDGNSRAHVVVLAAVLQHLGVDNDVIRARSQRPVFGGRTPVGVLRPASDLMSALAVP